MSRLEIGARVRITSASANMQHHVDAVGTVSELAEMGCWVQTDDGHTVYAYSVRSIERLEKLRRLRHIANLHALAAPAGSDLRRHRDARLTKIRAAIYAERGRA